ncbi:retrovirus-related pol polyprotein from transposon TNT 1-94 [Tanacetum coccineum]
MIFKRPVLIPALLCSTGLITNHGHNESDCTVGERKMDFKFFSRLIKDHLSLEPQGIHLELPLREVFFLDQKDLVLMMILVIWSEDERYDTMTIATLPQINNQLRTSSNTRNQATVHDGRIVVQNVQGRQNQNQNQNQRYFARGNGAAGNGGAQHRAGNANAGQGKLIKCYKYNRLGHIARNCTQPKRS